ncbi:MAG TPA: gamma-glutamyltransferase, partial [Gammaproteobacteria bacterium]|nr:gamma-glutamyltransferase [Gammaproteobacteria bacterium]
MLQKIKVIILGFVLLCAAINAFATQGLTQSAIASQHPLATQAGKEILKQGGNAFDAAVAMSAMLAVVEPYDSGLGGGGFWLLHLENEKEGHQDIVIDGRETAPKAAYEKMFVTDSGRLKVRLITQGALSAAIPGEPAALAYINKHYGKLSLAVCLRPAILVAKEGFEINEEYRAAILARKKLISSNPAIRNIFMPKGVIPKVGMRIRQPDLAETLSILAQEGHDGFYKGKVAEKLLKHVQAGGGIWSKSDLEEYQIKVREPLIGTYHDLKITTVGLPSAGGIALLTALNILEQFEMDPLSEADRDHLIIESLRRAYCDRALYLGDPDFIQAPVEKLISKTHGMMWRDTIDLNKKTESTSLQCGVQAPVGQQSTHFSILDEEGNRVGATLSINHAFGSGFVPVGTGVVLNNEMDDFAIAASIENAFGLIGHQANLIQPGKRPLSSMTPTFIESDLGIGVLGSQGGSRIPSMLLLAILDAKTGALPESWVRIKRFHHQYLPDVVNYEANAFDVPMQKALRIRGHALEPTGSPY